MDPHRPNPHGGLNQHTSSITGMISGAPPPSNAAANPHRNNPHGGLNQHSQDITGMISGAPPPSSSASAAALPAYASRIGTEPQPPPQFGGPRGPRPRGGPPPGGYGGYGGAGGFGFQPNRPQRPRGGFGGQGGFGAPRPRFGGPRPYGGPGGGGGETWRADPRPPRPPAPSITSAPLPKEPPRPPPAPAQDEPDEREKVEDARALARQRALENRAGFHSDSPAADGAKAPEPKDAPAAPNFATKQEPGFGGPPDAKRMKNEPMQQGSDIMAKLAAAGLLAGKPEAEKAATPPPTAAAKPAVKAPAKPISDEEEARLLTAAAEERKRLEAAEKAKKKKEADLFASMVDVKPDKKKLDELRSRPGPLRTKDSAYKAAIAEDSKTGIKDGFKVKAEKEDAGYALKDSYVGGQRIKGEKLSVDEFSKLAAQVAEAEAEVDAAQPLDLEDEDPVEKEKKRRAAILARLAKTGDFTSAESAQLESEKASAGSGGSAVGGAEWEKKLQSLLGFDDDTEDPDDDGDFGNRLDSLLFAGEAEEGEDKPVVEKPSRTSKCRKGVVFKSGGEMRVFLPKIRRRDYIRCAPNLKLHRIMMNPPDVRMVRVTPEEIHFWTRSSELFKPIRNEHEYKGLGLEVGLDNSISSVTHRQREDVKRRQAEAINRRRRMLELRQMEALAKKGPNAAALLRRSNLPTSVRDTDLPENLRFKKRAQLSGISKLPSFKKKSAAPAPAKDANGSAAKAVPQSSSAGSLNPLDHMERLSDDDGL